METWRDGQRRRTDGKRKRDIKRRETLKIQTERWRQTKTMVTEKERELHKVSWLLHPQEV